ncbi:MAG: glycosyltransferase family 2 protein [Candidatus Moranbacteria bacterium]|nr:glycosyltransferase family 2 protein [Candidatus Moranbacteria bacterium]
MPKFSIVIPVCGNRKFTDACIETIKANSSDYELIIVDNGSTPPYDGEGVIHRNSDNLGFPAAVNQGVKLSKGDYIVILNNDTLVTPNWLENLEFHMQQYDLIGPCTNHAPGPQEVITDFYKDNDALYEMAKKFHSDNQGQSTAFYKLIFFAVMIKRSVFDKIGLLDEAFSPGNFEDDDFCMRAIYHGFRCGIANDVFIHHQGSATHKSLSLDYKNLIAKNKKLFEKKWPISRYEILQNLNNTNKKGNSFLDGPSLALVMIAKNEEQGLENAVLSVRGIVSEIVIAVDDSSTDKTLELAGRLADTVKTYTWSDDFAAARNKAHEGVKSDYILFLDGHEYLKNGETIKKHLKEGGDSFLCSVELDNKSVIRNPRIYKNGVQFAGRVHELQVNIHPKFAIDVVIKHDRINSQSREAALLRDQQRDDQLPRIMGEELRRNPKNIRAAFHLALHFQTRSQWREALKMQKIFFKYSKVRSERWYMYFNQTFCYLAMGKNFRAWLSAGKADRETPGRWEIAKLRGLMCYNGKNYEKALDYLVASFGVNTGDVSYKPWSREIDGTWNLIGESFFRLGKYFEAGEAFRQASTLTKDEKFKDLLSRRSALMYKMAENSQ